MLHDCCPRMYSIHGSLYPWQPFQSWVVVLTNRGHYLPIIVVLIHFMVKCCMMQGDSYNIKWVYGTVQCPFGNRNPLIWNVLFYGYSAFLFEKISSQHLNILFKSLSLLACSMTADYCMYGEKRFWVMDWSIKHWQETSKRGDSLKWFFKEVKDMDSFVNRAI